MTAYVEPNRRGGRDGTLDQAGPDRAHDAGGVDAADERRRRAAATRRSRDELERGMIASVDARGRDGRGGPRAAAGGRAGGAAPADRGRLSRRERGRGAPGADRAARGGRRLAGGASDASERTLRRDGRRWTAWTGWVVGLFAVPGVAAARDRAADVPGRRCSASPTPGRCPGCRRAGARARSWRSASERSARVATSATRRRAGGAGAARATWSAMASATCCSRPGCAAARRARASGWSASRARFSCAAGGSDGASFCWCVRVGDAGGLPAADRVAHLLLALREDEDGFAKVANLGFSGAGWRVCRRLARRRARRSRR